MPGTLRREEDPGYRPACASRITIEEDTTALRIPEPNGSQQTPAGSNPNKQGYLLSIDLVFSGSSVMIPSTPAATTLRISSDSLTVQVKMR